MNSPRQSSLGDMLTIMNDGTFLLVRAAKRCPFGCEVVSAGRRYHVRPKRKRGDSRRRVLGTDNGKPQISKGNYGFIRLPE